MSFTNDVAETLERDIAKDLGAIAQVLAQGAHSPDDPLQNLELQSGRIERELSQCMLLAKTRIRDGFNYCIKAVQDLARTDTTINLEDLKENVNIAFSRFESVAIAKDLCTQVMQGTSWKSLLGLDETSMDLLYRGAKWLFEAEHYPESEAAFFFLTTVDYAQYAFWLGLGHAAFQLGNVNQSLNAYEMAQTCQPGGIWPHIHMANCFETLRDFEESLLCLQAAEKELLASPKKDPDLLVELKERIAKAAAKK